MKRKKDNKNYRKSRIIINIIFTIIMIWLVLICIDTISVNKYNKGPYFAIKLKESKYGYKEYYGLGYKVIKYNQENGRRDMEIGSWNLKANYTPIDMEDIDLAIEFQKDEVATYKKYYKKFVRIYSSVKEINKSNIVIGYNDEDNKYTLDIICNMKNTRNLEKDKEIIIVGTINDYKGSTKKENKRLYISNCLAAQ